MNRIVFTILIAGIASGCRSGATSNSIIDPPLPRHWASSHSSTNRAAGEWWQQFNDPVFDRLAVEALVNNIDLRLAANRLEQATIRLQLDKFSRRPAIEASLNTGKQKSSFIGLPFGGGNVMQSQTESHRLNLAARWEVDLWGRIAAGQQTLRLETLAQTLDYHAARHSIVAQVLKNWIQLCEASAQVTLARENIGILEMAQKQSLFRHNLGTVTVLDVRLAESNLTMAKAKLEDWLRHQTRLRHSLEAILGRYPSGIIQSPPSLPDTFPPIPAGVPADILKRRPDIAATMSRIHAAETHVAEGRAGLLPMVNLTASTGTSSNQLKDLLDSNFSVWSLGGNLAQTILLRDEQKTRINERRSKLNQAILTHRNVVMNAFREVESALSGDEQLAKQHQYLQAASLVSGKALDMAENRYARGVEPFITLLEAQRRFNDTRSQTIALHRLRIENRINLHLALGGDARREHIDP